jgi:hypothetical protein
LYLSYKQDRKCGTRQRLHGNVGSKKPLVATYRHVESNVQLLINQCTNVMPHQMKRIRNGRQDVQLLITNTNGKIFEKGTTRWGKVLDTC